MYLQGLILSLLPIYYLKLYQTPKLIPVIAMVYGITLSGLHEFFPKLNPFWLGALFGLTMSFIGRFIFDIPKSTFHMKEEWLVHVYAPILYGIVLYLVQKVV